MRKKMEEKTVKKKREEREDGKEKEKERSRRMRKKIIRHGTSIAYSWLFT